MAVPWRATRLSTLRARIRAAKPRIRNMPPAGFRFGESKPARLRRKNLKRAPLAPYVQRLGPTSAKAGPSPPAAAIEADRPKTSLKRADVALAAAGTLRGEHRARVARAKRTTACHCHAVGPIVILSQNYCSTVSRTVRRSRLPCGFSAAATSVAPTPEPRSWREISLPLPNFIPSR
jgi:hypothetical protein